MLTSVACRKTKESLSAEKEIATFSFKASDNVGSLTEDAIGITDGDTIKVTVDALSVSSLVASANFIGKSISPSLDSSVSFMEPVVYTVTAEDGSTKRYTVIVNTSFTLYAAGQDSYLYALDAVTGKIKWKYFLGVFAVTSPTFANGQVFICNRGDLQALDAFTGQRKWIRTLSSPRENTNLQVVDNTVYVASGGEISRVFAIDAGTGVKKWENSVLTTSFQNTLTFGDGNLVVGSYGLNCFDAFTGTRRWILAGDMMDENPVILKGSIYNGSKAYKVIAIDAATGQKKWGIVSPDPASDNGLGTSPTVHNGVLYQGGNTLNAYDTASGTQKWEYQPVNGPIVNPVGENGVIYATNLGDVVYAINSNGTLKWQYGGSGANNTYTKGASAVVAHGIVYSGSAINNKLIALNASTGQLLWSYESTAPFTAGPCFVDNKGNVFHAATSGAQQ